MNRSARIAAIAICTSMMALPASAEAVRKILYAPDGPVVAGISYFYAAMSGREGLDTAARKRGLATPGDKYGYAETFDKPRPKRRSLQRNYAGARACLSGSSAPSDISLYVRYRETKCEVVVFGMPRSYARQVVPVTAQVFEKPDPTLTLRRSFDKILVAGKGPSWHGGLSFNSTKHSRGVNCDIPRKGAAVWSVDLVHADILRKRYGG